MNRHVGRPFVRRGPEAGLTAQRIYQDRVSDQGFGGKYHSVRRYVRQLGPDAGFRARRPTC
ncbi:MAG TPA: hypothetical protein VG013_19835 [Gemmataceae bacterium]|nr:hypothetical protein [Gemmataceae bacterium]